MSALPISSFNFLASVNSEQPAANSKEKKENFASLLEIGEPAVDIQAQEKPVNTRSVSRAIQAGRQDIETPDKPAAERREERAENAAKPEPARKNTAKPNHQEKSSKPQTEKPDSAEENTTAKATPTGNKKSVSKPQEETAAENAVPVEQAAQQPLQTPQELADALRTQVDRLSALLASIIGLLSAAQTSHTTDAECGNLVTGQSIRLTAVSFTSVSVVSSQIAFGASGNVPANLAALQNNFGLTLDGLRALQQQVQTLQIALEAGKPIDPALLGEFDQASQSLLNILNTADASTGGNIILPLTGNDGGDIGRTIDNVLRAVQALAAKLPIRLLEQQTASAVTAPQDTANTQTPSTAVDANDHAPAKPRFDTPFVADSASSQQQAAFSVTNKSALSLLQAAVQVSAPASVSEQPATGNNSGNSNQGNSQPQAINGIRDISAPQQVSATGSTFSRALEQAASGSVLEQVAFHIKSKPSDGSSKIHIQLKPAELGRVEIKIDVASDGKTSVVVSADSKQTLDLLQRDTRGLEQALADAGLKSDSGSLSFNLRGGDSQGKEHSQASLNYQKSAPEEELLPPSVIARSYVVNLAEGLDIKI